MPTDTGHTFPKDERICGKTTISTIMEKGHWGSVSCLKYCYAPNSCDGKNRILVSVPKRHFKRAVRRNLLKRRIREAYRLNKGIVDSLGVDIMFIYSSSQIVEFSQIENDVKGILSKLAKK